MLKRLKIGFVAGLLIVAGAGPAAAQTGAPPSVVARTGTAAPAGGNYSDFTNPILNAAGQVAFLSNLTGGTSTFGLFAGAPGSLLTVGRQGTAAPAGGNYAGFSSVFVLNNSGQVAFLSNLTGGSSPSGAFAGAPGSVQAVALTGMTTPAGGTYNGYGDIVINGSGQVAFFSNVSTLSGPAVTAIFTGVPGSMQTVARSGTVAPAGGNFSGFSNPVLNGNGQVVFVANLTGGTSTSGLFAGAQTVALQNTAAPAGGNYNGFASPPVVNAAGQIAFFGFLSGGSSSSGIFAGAPGSLQAAARQGTAAPAGGNYSFFGNPVLNAVGQVAFRAGLNGGSSSRGIFTGLPGSVQATALSNTPAPAGGTFVDFSDPVLNGVGQVAFTAGLTGIGITGANDNALFAGAPGSLVQVVREGDMIDVDPGVGTLIRTVQNNGIAFLGVSGGQDGQRTTFNDAGLLVYRLTFTDGSSGVFTSAVPVPEPTGVLLVLVFASFVPRTYRRRVLSA